MSTGTAHSAAPRRRSARAAPLVAWAALTGGAILSSPTDAEAFGVKSAFTDACHEGLTMTAFSQARFALPVETIPLPRSKF